MVYGSFATGNSFLFFYAYFHMNTSRSYTSDTEGLRNRKVQDKVFFNHETADDVAEVISITPIRPL